MYSVKVISTGLFIDGGLVVGTRLLDHDIRSLRYVGFNPLSISMTVNTWSALVHLYEPSLSETE